jgi:signal transduction histidine kinase
MLPTRRSAFETHDTLADAFATFTASADELQRSYAQWSAEITVLRQHLQEKEAELAQEREKSRHLRALGEVAAVLAHEVRNPLASMELFAGLLAQSEILSEEERGWVTQLQAGFRQLNATVSNVLHFHGKSPVDLAPLEVSAVVCRALQFIIPLAKRSAVEVILTDDFGEARVAGNDEQLTQVLLNLAINSINAMPSGGALAVRGTTTADQVELSVRDSGPGIQVKVRDRIFEAGFTTRMGSAGLGLAVCKRIISDHGGTIAAVPGEPGAMFVIRLPRLKDGCDA